MIAFVEGEVRIIRPESVVVDVHGLGYEVFTPNPYAVPAGDTAFFYTYEHNREDARILFGFLREADYEVFLRLLNVRGIGPKSALNVLKAAPGKSIIEAVETGDIKTLKGLPGIGAKTASQIVLDLQGKFVAYKETEPEKSLDPVWRETEEALTALGYKPSDYKDIKKELEGSGLDVNAMLRQALNQLAKRKGVK